MDLVIIIDHVKKDVKSRAGILTVILVQPGSLLSRSET